jgi:hypothetical protein
MGAGQFDWWPEILDRRGQNQSGRGGYNQTDETIDVAE